ncbi:TonB-dependent receptor [Sphingomonas sp. IC-56]|uniref:TonB-dependent receptor plug domain-containing protein n=1 Tax=Sphingomonas sp. IC-56 TaxID=2898529 RepID=UPI001E4990A3|nr:TonB-dependent receptor [Sphingomonas sp. IC-56]MCD2322847.1 TonB-dependent receptor [Sphingomonas sp. IC-56]
MRASQLLVGAASVALMTAGQAWAQADVPLPPSTTQEEAAGQPESAGEVVVTGTSIRGVGAPASASVQLSREDFITSGAATSSDIARTLPQVVNIGSDESRRGGAQDAAANRTRTSSINLRGLSDEATLLLLNGRRLAPNGTIRALADPSMIPAIAIERLEVVPDGASAIYGADAVAGVVNMITRRPFNGAEVQLRYGGADGLDQMQGSALLSRKWASGGVIAAYEYYHRSNLEAADRDFTSSDLRSIGGTDQRSTFTAPGNIIVGGVRYPLPNGSGRNLTAAGLTAGSPNLFDSGRWGDLLPDQERHSVFVSAYQNLTDRLTLNYEGFYSNRTFFERVQPPTATLTVPRSNPFFVHPTNPLAQTVQVEYRFLDAARNASWSGSDVGWQNALRLSYDLDGDWQVNATASISKNRGRARTADVNNLQFIPLALASSDPATALNPFGNGALENNNPATLADVWGVRDSFTTNKSRDFTLKLDGPLFAIGGGDVRAAFGAEYHENDLRYVIYSSIKNRANDLLLDRDRAKSRNNKAVFGELNIPVFGAANATGGFQELTVQLAARYEEYSDFGDTFNPKVGVTWTPVDGFRLRGSWGTSFRAPSLIDSSDAIYNIFIQDFVDGGVRKRGIFQNGGNTDLDPEEATTWSIGADFRPAFLRGFSASATYYNIKYSNVISVLGGDTILSNNALYGQYVVRNPSAAQVEALLNHPNLESLREPAANLLLIVDGRRDNLGELHQDGIDVQVNQRIDTAIGAFTAGAALTQILNSDRSSAPGVPFQNALNIINFPVDTRIRGNLGWSNSNWSVNGYWNHVGDYLNNSVSTNQRVEAYNTFDASISYNFGDEGPFNGLRLTLSAQNVFDRDPPDVINGSSAWDSQNASPIGRFIAFDIRKSF